MKVVALASARVEVFKTNVNTVQEARRVMDRLQQDGAAWCISFDLEDCDRVLRVEGEDLDVDHILHLLADMGVQGRPLD